MARFLFVTWSGGGNVPPLVALGSQLVVRGHDVRVLGPEELRSRVEAERMTLCPMIPFTVGNPMFWPGAARDGLAADLRTSFDTVLSEVERGADVVVVDFMQPDALSAAESTGVPFAAFVHTLHGRGPVERSLPMEMRTDLAGLNELRSDAGLPRVELTAHVLNTANVVTVATVPELDEVEDPLPDNVRYVGPILEAPGSDAGWTPPFDVARPLVVIGMGTTAMGEESVVQKALDAVEELEVNAFVTVGGHLDAASFRAPPNAVVTGFVPHAAVMPHASVFVGHAGLGGISAALANGVPMVCVPLGRDQPMNAGRVASVGAGCTVAPEADAGELRDAMAAVLGDGRYRAIAARLAASIGAYGNGARAVEELERLA